MWCNKLRRPWFSPVLTSFLPMSRLRAAACLGAAILLTQLVGVLPAYAHASLVSTNPADGATVRTLPTEMSATFSENLGTPAYLVVTASNGDDVTNGEPTVLDDAVSVPLKDPGIRGEYSVSYRVVSADGHPIEGTLTFTVATGETRKVPATAPKADNQSFVRKHQASLMWGALAVVIVSGLLLWPARRRHD